MDCLATPKSKTCMPQVGSFLCKRAKAFLEGVLGQVHLNTDWPQSHKQHPCLSLEMGMATLELRTLHYKGQIMVSALEGFHCKSLVAR